MRERTPCTSSDQFSEKKKKLKSKNSALASKMGQIKSDKVSLTHWTSLNCRNPTTDFNCNGDSIEIAFDISWPLGTQKV